MNELAVLRARIGMLELAVEQLQQVPEADVDTSVVVATDCTMTVEAVVVPCGGRYVKSGDNYVLEGMSGTVTIKPLGPDDPGGPGWGLCYLAVLGWSSPTLIGNNWVVVNGTEPVPVTSYGGGSTSTGTVTTDDVPEGSLNLYWTQARFDAAFAAAITSVVDGNGYPVLDEAGNRVLKAA